MASTHSGENPYPVGPLKVRRKFSRVFGDQNVGDIPDPVGEGHKAGQVEHDLGFVARPIVGKLDQAKHFAVRIFHRANFVCALRADAKCRHSNSPSLGTTTTPSVAEAGSSESTLPFAGPGRTGGGRS